MFDLLHSLGIALLGCIIVYIGVWVIVEARQPYAWADRAFGALFTACGICVLTVVIEGI